MRWLLANGGTGEGSRLGGLHVTNLCVPDKELDLNGISVDFPVILERCRLGKLLLRDARLVTLKLTGTHCNGIAGDRLRVDHGLLLDRGFTAYETTRLPAIRVGDDLNCTDGRFAAGEAGKSALLLDGAHVDGRLYLNKVVAAPAFQKPREELDECEKAPARAGGTSAQGVRIGGNLLCTDSIFSTTSEEKSALQLEACVVDGNGVFVRMAANGDVKMRQARFSGTLSFRGAKLASVLDLRRSSVDGDVDFDSRKATPAMLGSKLMLSGAVVGGRLQMGRADLSGILTVDLSRASIGYLDDRHATWPTSANVLLEGISLGGIAVDTRPNAIEHRLAWLRPQNDADWSPQPYGQVVAALQLAGEEDAARRIAIGCERDRRDKGGLRWISQAWNWLLDKTIAYGYRPYWAFIWAIVVVIVCWFVFAGIFATMTFEHSDKHSHFYPLVYSIDAFLPIVDLGQASAHSPTGFWPHLTLWAEICLGWLLTTLGVVGVTGLIRNE
ncbi:MAG: hypothetical protein WA687_08310 [Solirubrobacterales bacterium]